MPQLIIHACIPKSGAAIHDCEACLGLLSNNGDFVHECKFFMNAFNAVVAANEALY